MALTPGTRIGVYEIVSAIGEGGMGQVYRARDSRLKRDVAIKVLPPQVAGDRGRLARFQREAEVLASLNHTRIAQIYGFEESVSGGAATPALVMELVEGDDLAQRIARGPIPIDEALAIARQIAEALEAAHEKGVVHRDLKPANIKVRADGAVKVLDFGLAKAMEPTAVMASDATPATMTSPAMTQAGIILGTPAYMSPEQARGKAVDTRTDIWAFGCVIFEMLAGRRPFEGETLTDTLAAIIEREPDWHLLSSAAPRIQRLVQRCLEKDPRQRLRDIGDARIELDGGSSAGRNSPSAAAPSARALRHNLPVELTSFVGRRQELTELAQMVASSRLLSLTGAGGAGKTRLALRLASDLVSQFRDGVWLVDLAPISDPDLVAQTIASAAGIREAPQQSMRDSLIENLRDREILIVLDNCEHLIDACAELVEALLRRAPALRIVATSRESLGVTGETVWRVASLSLPDTASRTVESLFASEATRLFIDRATALDPAFKATVENTATIARICERLDGIPLAIELAAARITALSVEQIDTRLQDRFRLLTGGTRTAVARQRTLEATMQWSYQLLSDMERQLLCRLSVFPAGWTLEAAEKVCGGDGIDAADMLDLLSRLASKSLVGLETRAASERRYRLLETVRQYARDRLMESGAADRLRDKHLEFFFSEFRGALPVLQGHGQVQCLKRLRLERDSVRAALEWALASPSHAETALELAGALFWYWTKRGEFAEGRSWLERALTVNAHGQPSLRARALIGLGHMLYFQGHYAELGEMNTEAAAVGREAGDSWAVSFALFGQALAAIEVGQFELAAARATEARAAARTIEDAVAGPLLILANFASANGDQDRAQQLFDESNEVNRRAGEIWGLGIGLLSSAGLRIVRQDLASARAQVTEAVSLNEQLEDPRGIAWSLEVFADLLAAGGHMETAARLWGASDRLLESVGGSMPPIIKWIRESYGERVKTALGPGPFEIANADGRAMPADQAVALARKESLSLQ